MFLPGRSVDSVGCISEIRTGMDEVTRILCRIEDGEATAEELLPAVYSTQRADDA